MHEICERTAYLGRWPWPCAAWPSKASKVACTSGTGALIIAGTSVVAPGLVGGVGFTAFSDGKVNQTAFQLILSFHWRQERQQK